MWIPYNRKPVRLRALNDAVPIIVDKPGAESFAKYYKEEHYNEGRIIHLIFAPERGELSFYVRNNDGTDDLYIFTLTPAAVLV